MSQVDFYLAKENAPVAIACKLLEKVYASALTAHVHCEDEATAKRLDDTLWTFKDASFIPHAKINEIEAGATPISIAHGDQLPPQITDVLVLMTPELPEFATQFNRILYIMPNDERWKTMARHYFKEFKSEGWQVGFHDV